MRENLDLERITEFPWGLLREWGKCLCNFGGLPLVGVRVHIIPDANCKPRVQCRKLTNTLSVGLDRKHETVWRPHSCACRPASTRTPVLVRLSRVDVFARVVDVVYSQESFVKHI